MSMTNLYNTWANCLPLFSHLLSLLFSLSAKANPEFLIQSRSGEGSAAMARPGEGRPALARPVVDGAQRGDAGEAGMRTPHAKTTILALCL